MSIEVLKGLSDEELRALVPELSFYHSVKIDDLLSTVGEFDIRSQINRYRFPKDMSGMSVLDIGRASGYFSFEFERRGAAVVSTELPTPLMKDFVGGQKTLEGKRAEYSPEELASIDSGEVGRVDFYVLHRLLKSKVKSKFCSAYDLSPKLFGRQFEMVFMGSLLNHLADPMRALIAARSVTNGQFVVCNPIDDNLDQSQSVAAFVGRRAKSLTTWWLPTVTCLVEMLLAVGFSDVEVVESDIQLPRPKLNRTMRHCVLHARNDDS